MNRMTRLLALALSPLFTAHTNAASMTIDGPACALVGDSFQLRILGDFSANGLIAGGITFFWDDALVQLDSITLNLPVDDDLSCPGNSNCPGPMANSAPIVWGQFLSNLIEPGDPAPTLMATLTFTAINASPPLAAFSMESNDELSGGWFGAGFTPIDTPSFESFRMEIKVPSPASSLLFGGALAGLSCVRRRRTDTVSLVSSSSV